MVSGVSQLLQARSLCLAHICWLIHWLLQGWNRARHTRLPLLCSLFLPSKICKLCCACFYTWSLHIDCVTHHFICFSIVFVSAQPYKSKFSHHNTIMMVFLMIVIFCCCRFGYNYSLMVHRETVYSLRSFIFILLTLPHAYVACLVLNWVYTRVPWKRLPLRCTRLRNGISTESTESTRYGSVWLCNKHN